MHAHRGREILVLPASCSSGSGHHHCHFTSDCPDSGNCLEKQSGKGVAVVSYFAQILVGVP